MCQVTSMHSQRNVSWNTHTHINTNKQKTHITSDQAEFGEDGGNFFPAGFFLDFFLLLFPRNMSGGFDFNKSNRL